MDPDLALVIGIVIGLFTVPSIMSVISDKRASGVPIFIVFVAGCFLFYAMWQKPSGYKLREIPGVFQNVLDRFSG